MNHVVGSSFARGGHAAGIAQQRSTPKSTQLMVPNSPAWVMPLARIRTIDGILRETFQASYRKNMGVWRKGALGPDSGRLVSLVLKTGRARDVEW
jgi:hypothetical protein